jgi:predicted secreted protein
MFEDQRAKRIIILAHCILNQNAKLDRCAHHQGAVADVVQVFLQNGIGIVQIECPEMLYLGLQRQASADSQATVEAEDTRIAERMTDDQAQALIDGIAQRIVGQIADYRDNGFAVLGILGINGSPTCGVETTWRCGCELAGHGQLIAAISRHLERRGITVPLRGIKSAQVEHAVRAAVEMVTHPRSSPAGR